MAQRTLKYYYQKAKKGGWALPQFNVSTAEQLQGIVQAAVKLKAPLLVGTSEGDSGFLGKSQAVSLVASYRKDTRLPIFLNFDHGKSLESIREAIEAGYDAVHFDGSRFSFQENIAETRKVVLSARRKNISVVEGEFEEVPGKHSMIHRGRGKVDPLRFTDPGKAALFAATTGVDSLAVMVGTVHGIYEGGNPGLDIARLQGIKKRVKCFLVLHGGSGTPPRDLLSAVKTGVVKVNVSTEIRAAFIDTLRKTLKENPGEITPYKLFPASVTEVEKVAIRYLKFLGSPNKI